MHNAVQELKKQLRNVLETMVCFEKRIEQLTKENQQFKERTVYLKILLNNSEKCECEIIKIGKQSSEEYETRYVKDLTIKTL